MTDLSKLIPPSLSELPPYEALRASSPNSVRLNAMESPYGLEELESKWLAALKKAEINRYPISHQRDFLRSLARSFDLPDSLLLGNGSDELILLLLLLTGSKKLLSPSPSFVMYEHLSRVVGATYIGVSLEEDFSLSTEKFVQAVRQHKPELIFLSLPNNPTGNFFSADLVEQTLQATEGLVVVDQAYCFFADSLSLPSLKRHNNLVLMRTLSKLGLAGLRFGFLAADPYLIGELQKIRLPYNINALTLASVEWALGQLDYFYAKASLIVEQREQLYQDMRSMTSIEVYPSQTNFLLFRCLTKSAQEVFDLLKEQKILVRNLHNSHPLLANCLRVSMGLPEENRSFLNGLANALS